MSERSEQSTPDSDVIVNVRARIHAARILAGWTLTEMAARCGVGRTYLYRLEQGGNPNILMLAKIAKGTGRPIEWFLLPVQMCSTCGRPWPEGLGGDMP